MLKNWLKVTAFVVCLFFASEEIARAADVYNFEARRWQKLAGRAMADRPPQEKGLTSRTLESISYLLAALHKRGRFLEAVRQLNAIAQENGREKLLSGQDMKAKGFILTGTFSMAIDWNNSQLRQWLKVNSEAELLAAQFRVENAYQKELVKALVDINFERLMAGNSPELESALRGLQWAAMSPIKEIRKAGRTKFAELGPEDIVITGRIRKARRAIHQMERRLKTLTPRERSMLRPVIGSSRDLKRAIDYIYNQWDATTLASLCLLTEIKHRKNKGDNQLQAPYGTLAHLYSQRAAQCEDMVELLTLHQPVLNKVLEEAECRDTCRELLGYLKDFAESVNWQALMDSEYKKMNEAFLSMGSEGGWTFLTNIVSDDGITAGYLSQGKFDKAFSGLNPLIKKGRWEILARMFLGSEYEEREMRGKTLQEKALDARGIFRPLALAFYLRKWWGYEFRESNRIGEKLDKALEQAEEFLASDTGRSGTVEKCVQGIKDIYQKNGLDAQNAVTLAMVLYYSDVLKTRGWHASHSILRKMLGKNGRPSEPFRALGPKEEQVCKALLYSSYMDTYVALRPFNLLRLSRYGLVLFALFLFIRRWNIIFIPENLIYASMGFAIATFAYHKLLKFMEHRYKGAHPLKTEAEPLEHTLARSRFLERKVLINWEMLEQIPGRLLRFGAGNPLVLIGLAHGFGHKLLGPSERRADIVTTVFLFGVLSGTLWLKLPTAAILLLVICSAIEVLRFVSLRTYSRSSRALIRIIESGSDTSIEDIQKDILREANIGSVSREMERYAQYCQKKKRFLEAARAYAILSEMTYDAQLKKDYRGRAMHAIKTEVYEWVKTRIPSRAKMPDAMRDTLIRVGAPVRIDYAHGGASDLFVISLERGGAVLSVPIIMSGKAPVIVSIRRIEEPEIRIKAKNYTEAAITKKEDLLNYDNPSDKLRLYKAALVLTGIVSEKDRRGLGDILKEFGGGIEIETDVTIPPGSGLAVSSILAAAVLKGLFTLTTGQPLAKENLVLYVFYLEQILGIGGGWQDSVGSLLGGFKAIRAKKGDVVPGETEIVLRQETVEELRRRQVLFYFGKSRFAGDILTEMMVDYLLRRKTKMAIRKKMEGLTDVAIGALDDGDIDNFGSRVKEAWNLWTQLVAGALPEDGFIRAVFEWLDEHCVGYKLTGAGGGGFAVFIAKKGQEEQLKEKLAVLMKILQATSREDISSLLNVIPEHYALRGLLENNYEDIQNSYSNSRLYDEWDFALQKGLTEEQRWVSPAVDTAHPNPGPAGLPALGPTLPAGTDWLTVAIIFVGSVLTAFILPSSYWLYQYGRLQGFDQALGWQVIVIMSIVELLGLILIGMLYIQVVMRRTIQLKVEQLENRLKKVGQYDSLPLQKPDDVLETLEGTEGWPWAEEGQIRIDCSARTLGFSTRERERLSKCIYLLGKELAREAAQYVKLPFYRRRKKIDVMAELQQALAELLNNASASSESIVVSWDFKKGTLSITDNGEPASKVRGILTNQLRTGGKKGLEQLLSMTKESISSETGGITANGLIVGSMLHRGLFLAYNSCRRLGGGMDIMPLHAPTWEKEMVIRFRPGKKLNIGRSPRRDAGFLNLAHQPHKEVILSRSENALVVQVCANLQNALDDKNKALTILGELDGLVKKRGIHARLLANGGIRTGVSIKERLEGMSTGFARENLTWRSAQKNKVEAIREWLDRWGGRVKKQPPSPEEKSHRWQNMLFVFLVSVFLLCMAASALSYSGIYGGGLKTLFSITDIRIITAALVVLTAALCTFLHIAVAREMKRGIKEDASAAIVSPWQSFLRNSRWLWRQDIRNKMAQVNPGDNKLKFRGQELKQDLFTLGLPHYTIMAMFFLTGIAGILGLGIVLHHFLYSQISINIFNQLISTITPLLIISGVAFGAVGYFLIFIGFPLAALTGLLIAQPVGLLCQIAVAVKYGGPVIAAMYVRVLGVPAPDEDNRHFLRTLAQSRDMRVLRNLLLTEIKTGRRKGKALTEALAFVIWFDWIYCKPLLGQHVVRSVLEKGSFGHFPPDVTPVWNIVEDALTRDYFLPERVERREVVGEIVDIIQKTGGMIMTAESQERQLLISIGGNSLIAKGQDLSNLSKAERDQKQIENLEKTFTRTLAIALLGGGIVTHGNGPQVGFCLKDLGYELAAMPARDIRDALIKHSIVEKTQEEIGGWIKQVLLKHYRELGIEVSPDKIEVVITHVLADRDDLAFKRPAKSIGCGQKVASPRPHGIIEAKRIAKARKAGKIVICTGGGGVPVDRYVYGKTGKMMVMGAVVDKDLASGLLEKELRRYGVTVADYIISTAEPYVFDHYKTKKQAAVHYLTPRRTHRRLQADSARTEYPDGSIRPKMEATAGSVERGVRSALITNLDYLSRLRGDNFQELEGTWTLPDPAPERRPAVYCAETLYRRL